LVIHLPHTKYNTVIYAETNLLTFPKESPRLQKLALLPSLRIHFSKRFKITAETRCKIVALLLEIATQDEIGNLLNLWICSLHHGLLNVYIDLKFK